MFLINTLKSNEKQEATPTKADGNDMGGFMLMRVVEPADPQRETFEESPQELHVTRKKRKKKTTKKKKNVVSIEEPIEVPPAESPITLDKTMQEHTSLLGRVNEENAPLYNMDAFNAESVGASISDSTDSNQDQASQTVEEILITPVKHLDTSDISDTAKEYSETRTEDQPSQPVNDSLEIIEEIEYVNEEEEIVEEQEEEPIRQNGYAFLHEDDEKESEDDLDFLKLIHQEAEKYKHMNKTEEPPKKVRRQTVRKATDLSKSPSSSDQELERLKREKEEQERIQQEKEEQERMQHEKEEQERILREEQERLDQIRLEQERLQHEKEEQDRIEREKEERERIEREEKERLEHIQREKEEQERLEQLRIQQEKEEQERLQREEQERLEQIRIQQEKEEQERLEQIRIQKEKEEHDRIEREKQEQIRLENERVQREKEEQDRLQREREEQERLEQIKIQQEREEQERLQREKEEQDRIEKEEQERLQREQEQQREKEEKERQEKIQREEQERIQREKEEQERLQREKEEQERLQKENEEQIRLENERIEREEKERLERIQREKEEQERLEQLRIQQEREEQERLQREKEEQDRVEREKQEQIRLENERIQREEQDRLQREKEEQTRLENERLAREKEEQERVAKEESERLEQERLQQEKDEQDRIQREKEEQERIQREKEEQERLEQLRIQQEKEEQERLQREEEYRLEQIRIQQEREEQERLEQIRIQKEKEEQDRIEREKEEQEKIQRLETERLETERQEQERLRVQKEEQERETKRLEKEKQERETAERLQLEKEQAEKLRQEKEEAERLENDRIQKEKEEQERIKREKEEQERLEQIRIQQEKEEQERLEQIKLENERIQREKDEQTKLENERLQLEKLQREEAERKQQELITKHKLEQEEKEKVERKRRAESELLAQKEHERLIVMNERNSSPRAKQEQKRSQKPRLIHADNDFDGEVVNFEDAIGMLSPSDKTPVLSRIQRLPTNANDSDDDLDFDIEEDADEVDFVQTNHSQSLGDEHDYMDEAVNTDHDISDVPSDSADQESLVITPIQISAQNAATSKLPAQTSAKMIMERELLESLAKDLIKASNQILSLSAQNQQMLSKKTIEDVRMASGRVNNFVSRRCAIIRPLHLNPAEDEALSEASSVGNNQLLEIMERLKEQEQELTAEQNISEGWKMKLKALDERIVLSSMNPNKSISASPHISSLASSAREMTQDSETGASNDVTDDTDLTMTDFSLPKGLNSQNYLRPLDQVSPISPMSVRSDPPQPVIRRSESSSSLVSTQSLMSTLSEAFLTNKNYFGDESPQEQQTEATHLKLIVDPVAGKKTDKEGKIEYKDALEEQQGRCPSCGKSLKNEYGWLRKPRYCYYTNKYYCTTCHSRNEKCVIPSKVIWDWNFTPYRTCNNAIDYLRSIHSSPLIFVSAINPAAFDTTPNLRKARMIRKRLMTQWDYIEHCPQKDLIMKRVKLGPNNLHYVQDTELYSMQNLCDLNCEPNRSPFLKQLAAIFHEFSEHITAHCGHCIKKAKSYCAANCKNREPIFEFNISAVVKCPLCNQTYHRKCFTKDGVKACPNCYHT